MSAPARTPGETTGQKRLRRAFYAACALLLALDLAIHRHAEHPWEGAFGFHAGYGFAACVLLVLAAKRMRLVLMRPEGYYGRRRPARPAVAGVSSMEDVPSKEGPPSGEGGSSAEGAPSDEGGPEEGGS